MWVSGVGAVGMGTRRGATTLLRLPRFLLARLATLPPHILRLVVCGLVSGITQVASNAATASMLLPVLLQLSTLLQV